MLLVIIIAYLLGSISFSYLAGRVTAGIDIREHGSGNAGATNTFRVLGPKVAVFVLLADLLKGVLAVLLAKWLTGDQVMAQVLAGIGVIAGHNWPVYFSFRGGKGIATTIGVAFCLVPLPALSAGLVALLLLFLLRIVSLASLTFTTLMPVFVLLNRLPSEYFWFTVILAAMSLWRHRSNVSRLLKGQEQQIGRTRHLE